MIFTELFRDDTFRLARAARNPPHSDSVVIQHKCSDEYDSERCDTSYDDGVWSYCWFADHKCSTCSVPVPLEMQGLRTLVEWER